MKKWTLLIVIIFLTIILTGCGFKKEVITFKDFRKITEDNQYTFVDSTDNFSEENGIEKVGIATNGYWQVEFYQLSTNHQANDLFESNKLTFIEDKTNTSFEKTSKGSNYQTYSLTTNTSYMYLSLIDNTLIYVRIPVEYRDEVIKFIEKTGY